MSEFWSNILRKPGVQMELPALLSTVPIFSDLSRNELLAIERILYRRSYAKEEVIFRQDDPGVGMYIIAEGTVRIYSEPDNVVLTRLETGAFFGEVALLNEMPRTATAVAETACVLWGFFQPELMDLLERKPRLGVRVLLPLARLAGIRLVAVDEQLRRCRALHNSKD